MRKGPRNRVRNPVRGGEIRSVLTLPIFLSLNVLATERLYLGESSDGRDELQSGVCSCSK